MRFSHLPRLSREHLLRQGLAGGAALTVGGGLLGGLAEAASDPFAGYPARNPQVAGRKATLRVWLTPELAAQPAYRTAIRLFQQMYPGITVVVTPVAKPDIPTQLKIAIAGKGPVPDLVSHHAYIFGAQGLAHESDALWAAYGREGDFLPAAMRDVTWRIDKFGIPLVSNAILTIVNAEMFSRAAVPLPSATTTFSRFQDAVSAVRRKNGSRYGMIVTADGATVTAVVHANGGQLFKTVAGRNVATLTDSRVTEAIRFYTELAWKSKLAPHPPTGPINPTYLAQLFAARQAPAFFGTTSDLALIAAIDPTLKLALAPLPGGFTGRISGSVNDGESLFIPAPSKLPHTAFELATWLVAQPPALAVARSLRLAPTVGRYYRDPYFHQDAVTNTTFQVAQTATPVGLDAYSEPYDLYLGAIAGAFGGQSPAALLHGIEGHAQETMDQADAGVDSDG